VTTGQINAWLEAAHEDLARLLAPTMAGTENRSAVIHATHRMYDARPALPGAQAFDTDRVSSSSSSSNPPPGFGQEDRAEQDRIELHKRAKRIREDADWLMRATQRWLPREPTPKDRTLSAINGKEDPGCEHCRTIGKWSAVRQGAGATRCNGNIEAAMSLCAFCYRYCLDVGTLPTKKQLEDHHNGARVKRPA
jgi:hypothetical protein